MKSEAEGIQMSQKSSKTAAELESIIMAELREHRESAAVAVIGPTSVDPWNIVLIREGPKIADECEARLAEITSRLRKEFDLAK